MQAETNHGIRRVNDNVYDIYIRDEHRREYRRMPKFQRPGVFNLTSQRWWKNGVKPKRDAMRQRCYDAEHRTRPTATQRVYSTVREVATFFRNIMESDWFQRRFPHFFMLRIALKPGTRGASACPTEHKYATNTNDPDFMQHVMRGWIGFSTWAMGQNGKNGGEIIMLHELAHAILPSGHEHDRRWARTFIELVTHFMGKEVGGRLKAEFRVGKIKLNPPRQVSNERRAAMAQVLSAARLLKPAAGLP